jgi:hypothetical protein
VPGSSLVSHHLWGSAPHPKLVMDETDATPQDCLWETPHMAATNTPDRLDTIENRLRRLEELIDRREMREASVEPWRYLVRRQHAWAKAALCQRAKHDGPAARRVD